MARWRRAEQARRSRSGGQEKIGEQVVVTWVAEGFRAGANEEICEGNEAGDGEVYSRVGGGVGDGGVLGVNGLSMRRGEKRSAVSSSHRTVWSDGGYRRWDKVNQRRRM